MKRNVLRGVMTEAIGTFFLVLTVGCVLFSKAALAPLAIGLALMIMVYAGGHISGGHYNPAVTLGVLIRSKISWQRAVAHWVAQVASAALATPVARYLIDPDRVRTLSPSVRATCIALLAEFLFTFALVHVMLNVATSSDHPHNGFYGLAIGLTVTAGAVAVGGVSGGAFNPAVAIGSAATGLFASAKIWI
ncbi:aquaporin [Streptomyces camponoticapitis]|uniref:Aquaporin n=2 Tax=Streptomyces camponoticapitis TaxID=1616125 RepID=A0ABQ2ESX2_9ACTN|nr:aquaporin [Streptomyces camponoticapitis]